MARQTNDSQRKGPFVVLHLAGYITTQNRGKHSGTGKLLVCHSNLTANTAKRRIIISLIGQLLCVCMLECLTVHVLLHIQWQGSIWYIDALACGVHSDGHKEAAVAMAAATFHRRRQTKRGHGSSICPPTWSFDWNFSMILKTTTARTVAIILDDHADQLNELCVCVCVCLCS